MSQNRPQLGAVMTVAVIAAWVGIFVTPAFAAPAFAKKALVERTGQTTSYAAGDDGDIQAGVKWPTPRFKDKGNGTVKDKLTGLIWLKNANCFGGRTWAQALTDANTLASGSCGLSDGSVAGDWRLPNVKELQSLIDFAFFAPALSNAAGTGQWTEGDAFSGVVFGTSYWSSTTYAADASLSWRVSLNLGELATGPKGISYVVWPVRGGQ